MKAEEYEWLLYSEMWMYKQRSETLEWEVKRLNGIIDEMKEKQ